MRKTLASIASVAIMFGNVAGVLAAENDTAVINSGSNLTVNSSANETNTVVVNNNNEANVVQTSSSVNISGQNTASGNISLPSGCGLCVPAGTGTSITTGAATSTSNMTVDANSNETAVLLPGSGGSSNDANVVNTGTNVTVNAAANTTNTAVVNNSNSAKVYQSSNAVNISGQNTADNNIGTTSILTGPSGSSHVMGVDVNSNTTVIGLGSGLGDTLDFGDCFECVPCDASNCTDVTNTGNNLTVNSSSNTTTTAVVNNSNRLWAAQKVFAVNISGQNTASNNIGGGDITTGPSVALSDMMVEGNSNETAIALGAGMPLGANMLNVVNTGASVTTNAAANTNSVVVANNSNSLFGWQASWTVSSSGQNVSLSNIGGASTTTSGAESAGIFGLSGNSNTTIFGNFLSLPLWLLLFGL